MFGLSSSVTSYKEFIRRREAQKIFFFMLPMDSIRPFDLCKGAQSGESGRERMEASVFRRKISGNQGKASKNLQREFSQRLIEALEDRQLLSVTVAHHNLHAHKSHHAARHASKHHSTATTASTATASVVTASDTSSTTTDTDSSTYQDHGRLIDTVEFQLAPDAVKTGLESLASTDGLTAPAATQIVRLGNSNGVETYTLDYTTTGTQTRVTVDQNGVAVTAPTQSTITWADLNGSGTSSNSAAAAEITTIATALSLTAPTDATVVHVSTTASGSTFSVELTDSASTSEYDHGRNIAVDANGNPVGNQELPFSALPGAIQGFINANIPTGATALDAASTQTVHVRTIDGVVTYATDFTVSGTTTKVIVDLAGAAVTPTAATTTTFDLIPTLAHDELQALATAEGVTATIPTTQTVTVFTELNGTVIYSVTLSETDSTSSQTYNITLASDALGDATVPPGRGGHGFDGPGFGGPGGGCGPDGPHRPGGR